MKNKKCKVIFVIMLHKSNHKECFCIFLDEKTFCIYYLYRVVCDNNAYQ